MATRCPECYLFNLKSQSHNSKRGYRCSDCDRWFPEDEINMPNIGDYVRRNVSSSDEFA